MSRSKVVRPIGAVRTGNVITVRFSDDDVVELPCPAALIGNPVSREIVELGYIEAHTTGDFRPQWQTPDAGDLAAQLRSVMEQMPVSTWRGLDIEPGWHELVIAMHRELVEIADDYVLVQVQQSKTRLRTWLWHNEPDVLRQLRQVTHAAAERSTRTCEWCGHAALPEAVGPGWHMRLCADCSAFRAAWEAAWRKASES